jgi:hypothetical protein
VKHLSIEFLNGNKRLYLANGKAASGVGATDKFLGVIDAVIKAVEAGELDEMLLAIRKDGLRSR